MHASFDVHYIIHAARKYFHPDKPSGFLSQTKRHEIQDPRYFEQENNHRSLK